MTKLTDLKIEKGLSNLNNLFSIIIMILLLTIILINFIIYKRKKRSRVKNLKIICYSSLLLLLNSILCLTGFYYKIKPDKWTLYEACVTEVKTDKKKTFFYVDKGDRSFETCKECVEVGNQVYIVVDKKTDKIINYYLKDKYKYKGDKLVK